MPRPCSRGECIAGAPLFEPLKVNPMTIYLDAQSQDYMKSLGTTNKDDAKTTAIAKLNAALMYNAQIDAETVHFLVDAYNDDTGDMESMANELYDGFAAGSDQNRVMIYMKRGGAITDELAPLLTDPQFALGNDHLYHADQFYSYLGSMLYNGAQTPGYAPPAAAIAAFQNAPSQFDYGVFRADAANPDGHLIYNVNGADSTQFAQTKAQDFFTYATDNKQAIDPALIQAYIGLDRTDAANWISNKIHDSIRTNTDGWCPPELLTAFKDIDVACDTIPTSASPGFYGFYALDSSFPNGHTLTGWTWDALCSLRKSIDNRLPVNADMLQQMDAKDPWAGAYVRWWALKKEAADGTLDANYLGQLNSTNPDQVADLCETALKAEDADGKTLNTQYLNLFATNDPPGATTFCESILNAEIAAHENLNPDCLNIVAANDPIAAADLCTRELQDALRPTNALLNAAGVVNPLDRTSDRTPVIRVDLGGMGTPAPVEGDLVTLFTDGAQGSARALTAGEIAQGYADVTIGAPLLGGARSITSQVKHTVTASDGTQTQQLSALSTPLSVIVEPNTLQTDSGGSNTDKITNDDTPTIRVSLADLVGLPGIDTPPKAGDYVRVLAGSTLIKSVALSSTNITSGFVDVTLNTSADGTSYQVPDGTHTYTTLLMPIDATAPNQNIDPQGDPSPNVTVTLSDFPSSLRQVGKIVTIFMDGMATVSHTLTQANITAGTFAMTVNQWADGSTLNVTDVPHDFTPKLHEPALDTKAPLTFTVDTAPPTITSARYSGTTLVLNFNSAVGGSASATDFRLDTYYGGAVNPALDRGSPANEVSVTKVTVDAANNRVFLTLSGEPNPNWGLWVVYDGTGNLVDRAGNKVEAIPDAFQTGAVAVSYALSGVAAIAASALTYPQAPVAPPPARAMDANAMSVLQALNPSLARIWEDKFTTAGLVAKPAAAGPAPLDLSLDIDTLLWMVFTNRAKAVEDQLKQQIAITQQKNDTLGKLNELLGAMNEMDAAVPSGADSGNSLRSKLGDNYGTLRDKVNAACQTSGLQPFPGTSGQVDDSTTISQLRQAIQNLKAQIDSLANLQQLDMLRMQNLTTKRNESWDTISNQMEKSSSTRKAIIDNMR
jgi:hypothetical protein